MNFYADQYFHWGFDDGLFNRPNHDDSKLSIVFSSPSRDVGSFRDEMLHAVSVLKDETGGDRITLSLSGGSDSQITAYCMKHVGLDFTPIHAVVSIKGHVINKAETRQAELFCKKHDLVLVKEHIDLGQRIDFYLDISKGARFTHFYRFINLDLALRYKDQLNIAVSGDVIYEALLDSSGEWSGSDFRTYDDLRMYSEELGVQMFSSFYKIDPHLYYSLTTSDLFFIYNDLYSFYNKGVDRYLDKTNISTELDRRYFYGNFIKYVLINQSFPGILINNNKLFPSDLRPDLYYSVKDRWLDKGHWHPKFTKELNIDYREIINLSKQRNVKQTFVF